MPDFKTLTEKLGTSFNNLNLLIEALTHRSYLNEHREYTGSHNERLEFLGDAVLELATTDFLYKKFPAKPEGELTSYRAALVNTVSLAESAQALGINEYLLLSKGESKDTGRARDVILADALEATIADSIPADGTIPSVKQALYMLTQFMLERSVAGTTWPDR